MVSAEEVNEIVNNYRSKQEKLKEAQLCKQQLLIQENENRSVLQELTKLEDDAILYKSVGPILVTQQLNESIAVVEKRLTYITQELQRVDKLSDDLSSQIKVCAKKIEEIQEKMAVQAQ